MKFHKIRSRVCGEMALDGWTDGQTNKRIHRCMHIVAIICLTEIFPGAK